MKKTTITNRTYTNVITVLHKMGVLNLGGVEEIVTVSDHGVLIKLPGSNPDAKLLSKTLRSIMEQITDAFEYTVRIGKKNKTVRYPTVWDNMQEFDLKTFWYDTFVRSTLIMCLYLTVVIITLAKVTDLNEEAIRALGDMVFTISSLITAFLISFLVSKILAIRQEKLSRVARIKMLSNRWTEFRRICYFLVDSWKFWKPSRESYVHGKSVAKQITYTDLHYLDVHDDQQFEFVTNLMDYHKFGEMEQKFTLQLETFVWSQNRRLYQQTLMGTDYPANYIYSKTELDRWAFFGDSNLFWYIMENEWQDYQDSFDFNIPAPTLNAILGCAKRFDGQFGNINFDQNFLVKISQVAENEVLPELNLLIEKNESKMPFLIDYLMTCLVLIFLFGILLPINLRMFSAGIFIDLISIIIVSAIIIHILLCMPSILRTEIWIDRKKDYH